MEMEVGDILQPFNLPLFLSIEENNTRDLISKLDREFSNIKSKKIMLFTSEYLLQNRNGQSCKKNSPVLQL